MARTPRTAEFLRRADQAMVATLLVLGAVVIGCWLAAESGLRQRMIEADRPEPKVARFQVDINTAQPPELIQLPGIGEALAERIVENRRAEGPFRDAEDLCRIPGIGPKTLENIRPYLLPLSDHRSLAGP